MRETKFTEGPWQVLRGRDSGHIIRMGEAIESPHQFTCHLEIEYDHGLTPRNGAHFKEAEANATLIAAAPDLYEACAEFVRKCECGEAKSVRSYKQMRAALDKVAATPKRDRP